MAAMKDNNMAIVSMIVIWRFTSGYLSGHLDSTSCIESIYDHKDLLSMLYNRTILIKEIREIHRIYSGNKSTCIHTRQRLYKHLPTECLEMNCCRYLQIFESFSHSI